MAFLGNIIWFILGGWLLFILYSIAAVIFFPMFLPLFRIAKYSAFPFGRTVISKRKLDKYRELNGNDTESSTMTTIAGILNIVWVITFGWILALSHLLASIANLFLFFSDYNNSKHNRSLENDKNSIYAFQYSYYSKRPCN